MRIVSLVAFLAVSAGGIYFFGQPRPADQFALPVGDAYAKLSAIKVEPGNNSMYYGLSTTVTGNGKNQVVWTGSGSMAMHRCTLDLASVVDKPEETHVKVTCEGGGVGEGAAAGMAHNMIRNRVLEMVDATLGGREFSNARVGSTASRWPGDGVDGSMGTAVGTALKMDADMQKMRAEEATFRKKEQAEAAASAEQASEAAIEREERTKAGGNSY